MPSARPAICRVGKAAAQIGVGVTPSNDGGSTPTEARCRTGRSWSGQVPPAREGAPVASRGEPGGGRGPAFAGDAGPGRRPRFAGGELRGPLGVHPATCPLAYARVVHESASGICGSGQRRPARCCPPRLRPDRRALRRRTPGAPEAPVGADVEAARLHLYRHPPMQHLARPSRPRRRPRRPSPPMSGAGRRARCPARRRSASRPSSRAAPGSLQRGRHPPHNGIRPLPEGGPHRCRRHPRRPAPGLSDAAVGRERCPVPGTAGAQRYDGRRLPACRTAGVRPGNGPCHQRQPRPEVSHGGADTSTRVRPGFQPGSTGHRAASPSSCDARR